MRNIANKRTFRSILIFSHSNHQWLGEPDLRYKMQGRMILVHLMCRDMATTVQKMLSPSTGDAFGGATGIRNLADINCETYYAKIRYKNRNIARTHYIHRIVFDDSRLL